MSKLNKAAAPKQAQPVQQAIPVPHKHHDAIVAFAQGYQIQKRKPGHPFESAKNWHDVPADVQPGWRLDWEYRKKPDPVEDIVLCRRAMLQSSMHGDYFTHSLATTSFNVRYTFDGETKQLKNVEMLK